MLWGVSWYLKGHSKNSGSFTYVAVAVIGLQNLWCAKEMIFISENQVLIWKTDGWSSLCHLELGAVERSNVSSYIAMFGGSLPGTEPHFVHNTWCWGLWQIRENPSEQAGCLQWSGNDTEMQSKLPCVFHTSRQFWLISSETQTSPQSQLRNESHDLIVWLTVSRDLCSCLEGFCRSGEKNLLIIELVLVSYGKVITAPKHEEASFSFHCALPPW